ncbi:MAG: hypothetical protein HYX90_09470 [Chloroflexi bacterium]|nr:hypothetical protein [Chloroflexota bacterium]
MVVPSGPGGSTDIAARLYAKYLPTFLPGNPGIVVKNMPGGASTLGANYAYASKPDGLTLLAPSIGVNIAQMLGTSAVKYDLLKMTTLFGAPSGVIYYVRPGVIAKAEDLPKTRGLVFAAGSGSAPSVVLFLVAKELLSIPTEKVLFGYSGAAEAFRALLTGEINFSGETGTGYNATAAAYVEKGEVVALFQSGLLDEKGNVVRDANLPPVPTTKEIYEKVNGKPPSGMAWDAYKVVAAGGLSYARTLLLPPGTPDSITRVYFSAAEAMLKEPGFRSVVEPLIGKGTTWGVGEAYDKRFKADFDMKPEISAWLRETLKKSGVVVA